MGTRRLWVLLLAAVGTAARAQSIESNFRPYLVGGRAAGMGGAFTALSDDGSGGYYNPGGLAFIRASSLSFSLNAYGLAGGTVKDALGDGNDFVYRDLNIFPVATAGIKKLGDYHVIRHAVVNVSVGGEVALGAGFTFRAGFFTDFASSDATRTDVDNTSHVNHYGLSLSGGLRTEHVRTDIGFTGWYGKGTDVIPKNLDFSFLARADATEYGVFIFLATAYDF